MRTVKNWIIAAIVLLVVGGGIATIGFAMGGFNILKLNLNNSNLTYRDWGIEGIHQVVLDAGQADIYVTRGAQKGNVSAVEQHTTVEVKNGTLYIKQGGNRKWYQLIQFGELMQSEKVELVLPQSFAGNLDLHTSLGEITLTDLGKLGNVSCDSSLGDLQVTNVESGTVSIGTNSGSISLQNVQAGDLEVEAELGDVHLQQVWTKSLRAQVQSGNTSLNQVEATSVTVDSSLGDIDVDALKADEILLDSQLGSIRGSIVGNQADYTIKIDKNLGDSTLRDQTGGNKKLDAQVDLGDIDLSFE